MSKLSMGTYLGDFSDEDSKKYRESIKYGLLNGIRYIDTAVNYRGMRSERDIGFVLRDLFNENLMKREDIVISSKAGFIPGDGEIMLKPVDYLKEKFIKTGLLSMDDIELNKGLRLTMNPKFYDYALNLSLKHLNTSYLDVHYIHEPELMKEMIGNEKFYENLKPLFEFYEKKVEEGIIKAYGMAVWHCFELDADHPRHISLEKVIEVASSVKTDHSFKHIMLPYNKIMNDAETKKTQLVSDAYISALEAAKRFGLTVSTSGSIHRGKEQETNHIMDHFENNILNEHIDIMIVGMKHIEHMKENMMSYQTVIEKINNF